MRIDRLRTAVIVPVSPAAAMVDVWRERTCSDMPSSGVPAHITLVFPFVPAAELDAPTIAALTQVVGETAAFAFELRATARFPSTLSLAPEPAAPFVRLTEAIVARFPAPSSASPRRKLRRIGAVGVACRLDQRPVQRGQDDRRGTARRPDRTGAAARPGAARSDAP